MFALPKTTGVVIPDYVLRDVCARMFVEAQLMGGEGCIVQIDESLFAGKRKYNGGRLLAQDVGARPGPRGGRRRTSYGDRMVGPWVFGMLLIRNDYREIRMFYVKKRDAATLIPIIRKHVLPGTEIHYDQWAAYRNLSKYGYVHKTVNHSENFVDPNSGAHTQNVECWWHHVKTKLLRLNPHLKDAALLERYLQEEWWRSVNRSHDLRSKVAHLYEAFLRDLRIVFRNIEEEEDDDDD